jgi:hypothetical protein
MVSGEVLINNQPARSKLARFIEKKIHQWVTQNQAGQHKDKESTLPENLAYKVAFTEDEVKQVSCETEINVGGHLWRGCELATDTQMAFIHSMKRLQPH